MEIRKNFEKIMKFLCSSYEIYFYLILWTISNHYLLKINGEINHTLLWGGIIYAFYLFYNLIHKPLHNKNNDHNDER